MKTKVSEKTSLFSEFFRQLLPLGLFSVIAVSIIEILTAILKSRSMITVDASGKEAISHSSIGMVNMCVPATAFAMLAAFVLTMIVFSFLNKRNALDYYFSLPVKRSHLFLTAFGAVCAWVAVILLSGACISLIMYSIYSKMFTIEASTIAPFLLDVFAGSMFIAAGTALAMSVTGTAFNNILVSLLVLFTPRTLMYVIQNCVCDIVPIINIGAGDSILDPKKNILFGLLFESLLSNEWNMNAVLLNVSSGIYTLIVSIIYIIAAVLLFRVRKGENAGRISSGSAANNVFAVWISFIITILACYFIFMTRYQEYGQEYYSGYISGSFVAAMFVYILYQLAMNRKIKPMLKTLPWFLVVLVLDAAVYGTMAGATKAALAFSPDTDKIESISLYSPEYTAYYDSSYPSSLSGITPSFGTNDTQRYITDKTKNISVTDSTVRAMVSKALKAETATLRNDGSDEYYETYPTENYVEWGMYIETSTGRHFRTVYLSKASSKKLLAVLSKTDGFKDVSSSFPKVGENSTVVEDITYDYYGDDQSYITLTKKQKEKAYALYRQDMSELSYAKMYSVINYFDRSQKYVAVFTVNTYENGKEYSLTFPVNKSMKRTSSYLGTIGKAEVNKNRQKVINLLSEDQALLRQQIKDEKLVISVSSNSAVASDGSIKKISGYVTDLTGIDLNALAKYLETTGKVPVDVKKPFVHIDYVYSDDNKSVSCTFQLTDGKIPDVLSSLYTADAGDGE